MKPWARVPCALLAASSIVAIPAVAAAAFERASSIGPPTQDCDAIRIRRFGSSIAVGDVDGDGAQDLIAAPGMLFYGNGTGGFGDPIDLRVDGDVVMVVDVNGDELGDLVLVDSGVKLTAYHGSRVRLTETDLPDWTYSGSFGALAHADMNGDGIDDVVVGGVSGAGAYVFYGSTSGLPPDLQWDFHVEDGPGTQLEDGVDRSYRVTGIGAAVARAAAACAGTTCVDQFALGAPTTAIDMNGNGVFDTSELNMGAVVVGPRWEFLAGDRVRHTYFGYAVADAGDVNGDGLLDLIASARANSTTRPKVFLFLGTSEGFVRVEREFAWSVVGSAPYTDGFGAKVHGLGDLDGDGYDDIFVADPMFDSIGGRDPTTALGYWGRALIWYGGPPRVDDRSGLGLAPTPDSADEVLDGLAGSGYGFGSAVAVADVDGDGAQDLLIGDPRAARLCYSSGATGFEEVGEVHVYLSLLGPIDADGDGVGDEWDNCVGVPNPDQADQDHDGRGDACDRCPTVYGDQADADADGLGDRCDPCPSDPANDGDGDFVCSGTGFVPPNVGDRDNCGTTYNPTQVDGDHDGIGDACDNCTARANADQADLDADGVGNLCDNCFRSRYDPVLDRVVASDAYNPTQVDGDGDLRGDACDNCPGVPNSDQADLDGDLLGDACDPDDDQDGFSDGSDVCPRVADPQQRDTDGDGVGDACNDALDRDHDEWADARDNCVGFFNPSQADVDGNGVGDVCQSDLRIARIEQTQAIQNTGGTVPLVASKGTWIRVHLETGSLFNVAGVTGTLRFVDAIGRAIFPWYGPYEPIAPTPNLITAKTSPDPGKTEDTLNFYVGGEWFFEVTPYVEISVWSASIQDVNPDNNQAMRLLGPFTETRRLNAAFVPVRTRLSGGSWCAFPTRDDWWQTVGWMEAIMPLSYVDMWPEDTMSLDDVMGAGTVSMSLLSQLYLRNALTDDFWDGMHYVGLVCQDPGAVLEASDGTRGAGYLPGDECWARRLHETGSDFTWGGYTVAHELGHNHGRQHAPCGSPDDPDASFPWSDGRINGYGFGPHASASGYDGPRAFGPSTGDLMSYCRPRWQSEYTYRALLNAL